MPSYNHAKFGGNWTTNKGETEGGYNCPPQPIWFQKTPGLRSDNKYLVLATGGQNKHKTIVHLLPKYHDHC